MPWPMQLTRDAAIPAPDQVVKRRARLFRNGRHQAVRIPREFELPNEEVILYKDGERLLVEPVKKPTHLLELLAMLEPIENDFPDVDAGLPALELY